MDKFVPTAPMVALVNAAKRYLYQGDPLLAALHPIDLTAWEDEAGLPRGQFAAWLDYFGEPFSEWFGGALLPSPLEQYAMDALWWRAWRGVLASDKSPSATHLKAWGEMRGHFDDKPPPPPIRHLTAEEALAELVSMGPSVLETALSIAYDREEIRRDPDGKPSTNEAPKSA